MDKIKIIISLLATTLSLLFTTSLSLFKFINSKKLNKKIIDLIKIAKEFTNYSGIEKKEYVLTKLNQLSIDNKVNFCIEKASSKIEEFISLSKNVNAKEKENGSK